MRYLITSLLCVVVLASCSLPTTEGLRQVHFSKTEVKNPYFANEEIDYVYKAKIEVYRKNFGGILIVKKMGPNNHRVVFTTEFGSKLFDFQFEGDNFIAHYVIEDLDKKFIVNILKNDFSLLVKENASVYEVYESENHRVYKTLSDDRFNFYFLNEKTQALEKIVNTTKTKEKVSITFTASEENIADAISINHDNIKLAITLDKFKNE